MGKQEDAGAFFVDAEASARKALAELDTKKKWDPVLLGGATAISTIGMPWLFVSGLVAAFSDARDEDNNFIVPKWSALYTLDKLEDRRREHFNSLRAPIEERLKSIEETLSESLTIEDEVGI